MADFQMIPTFTFRFDLMLNLKILPKILIIRSWNPVKTAENPYFTGVINPSLTKSSRMGVNGFVNSNEANDLKRGQR